MKIRMHRYGETGWWFTVTTDAQPEFDQPAQTFRYRTNPAGDGLWQYCRSNTTWYPNGSPFMEWKQIEGTCQFYLPKDRKRAYDKIRYTWMKGDA